MTKRATQADHPTKVDWQIPLKGDLGEWYPIIRVGRHIPFGYKQDENDEDLLIPIPEELELLEKAKLFLKDYSTRQVAKWLSDNSGRYSRGYMVYPSITQNMVKQVLDKDVKIVPMKDYVKPEVVKEVLPKAKSESLEDAIKKQQDFIKGKVKN